MKLVGRRCFLAFLMYVTCQQSGFVLGEVKEYKISELAASLEDSFVHGQQVRTRGVVVWVNPYWHNLIIASETDPQGLSVTLQELQELHELRAGDLVEVEAEFSVWGKMPSLNALSTKKIGVGELPAPESISLASSEAELRELEGRRISVEGKVRYLIQYFNRYVFWIDGYSLPINIEFREMASATQALDYAGATLRVTGVVMQRGEKHKQPARLTLKANSVEDIEVVEPPPMPSSDEEAEGTRGVIVCRKSANHYFVRTNSHDKEIVDVELYNGNFLNVGDHVRYKGYEIVDAVGKRTVVTGIQVDSAARDWFFVEPVESGKAHSASRSGDWVCFSGTTESNIEQQLTEGWFGLRDKNGQLIRVVVGNLEGDLDTLQLSTATSIEVSGYIDIERQRLSIYPREFMDLRVTQRRHWYQTSRARWLGFGILIVMIASLSGVFFLRTLVHRRTRDLEESTALLNASYDAILEGICLVNADGEIQKANPRFWELLGLDPADVAGLRGRALRDRLGDCFQQPEEFARLWNRAGDGDQSREDYNLDRKTEPAAQLNVYAVAADTQGTMGDKLGHVWVLHDLTQQRRLEKSLLQAQKMEVVGRLAGGIAHDFNNMLAGISGNLEVAKLNAKKPAESLVYVKAAEYGVGRAAALVKGLLGFSRQSTLEVKRGSANEVIEALLALLKPTLDPKSQLKADLAEDLGLANIDIVQLEQVLLNLVVNAQDALPEAGGAIALKTRNVQAAENPGEPPIECIEISVCDNGCGIEPEVVANVFEPFFSTKSPGQGTGLGLATSLGVIQQLNGWITCDSILGQGTVFRVFLPRVMAQQPLQQEMATASRQLTEIDSSIHVLCVDDEDFVRQSAEAMLQAVGFKTSVAENGENALEVLAASATNGKELPDVVLLDQTMPKLSGAETLPLIRSRFPKLPVILCSGFLANLDDFSEKAGSRPDGFIQKPYLGHQLKSVVEQVVAKV